MNLTIDSTNIHDEDDMSRFIQVMSIFAQRTSVSNTLSNTFNDQFISDQSPALCHPSSGLGAAGGKEIMWRREGVF